MERYKYEHGHDQPKGELSAGERFRSARGSRWALLALAVLSLVPVADHLLRAKGQKWQQVFDFQKTAREGMDHVLRLAPQAVKEGTVRGQWERAEASAQAGDLYSAGLALHEMHERMRERHIDPASLPYREEHEILCRKAAQEHVTNAMKQVTEGEDGISPYGKKLTAIRSSLNVRSTEDDAANATERYSNADPRPSLNLAASLLSTIGEKPDLHSFLPFVHGMFRDDCTFAKEVDPATDLGRAAIRRMCYTGHTYHPEGTRGAFNDALTSEDITALAQRLWEAAQESVRNGEEQSSALQHIATLCLLLRGAPQATAGVRASLGLETGATELSEEDIYTALRAKGG